MIFLFFFTAKISHFNFSKIIINFHRHAKFFSNDLRGFHGANKWRGNNKINSTSIFKLSCFFINLCFSRFSQMMLIIYFSRQYKFNILRGFAVSQNMICISRFCFFKITVTSDNFFIIARITKPNRKWCAPITFTGKSPILNLAQPFAKTAFLNIIRHPVNLIIGFQ